MMGVGTDNARELELIAISSIMSHEDGRKFLMRILERAATFDDTFDNDPYTHARNSGMRSVGTWLQNELTEADLPKYLQMLKEHYDE